MSERQQGTEPRNVDVAEPQASSGDTSATAGYTVGYKRLPVHSRFKPGHSGDPKGRLPGSANAKTTVQRVMNEKVSVRRGQKTSTVSALELVQGHAVEAIKGDPRSAAMVINVMTRTGLLADKEDDGPLESVKRAALADKARSSDAVFENIDAARGPKRTATSTYSSFDGTGSRATLSSTSSPSSSSDMPRTIARYSSVTSSASL
jgi:hypothetical protein